MIAPTVSKASRSSFALSLRDTERRPGGYLRVTVEEPADEAADVVVRRCDAAVHGHGHIGDELLHDWLLESGV